MYKSMIRVLMSARIPSPSIGCFSLDFVQVSGKTRDSSAIQYFIRAVTYVNASAFSDSWVAGFVKTGSTKQMAAQASDASGEALTAWLSDTAPIESTALSQLQYRGRSEPWSRLVSLQFVLFGTFFLYGMRMRGQGRHLERNQVVSAQ